MNKKYEKIIILLLDFLTINLAWIVYFIFRVKTGWFRSIIMPEFIIPMLVVYFYWLIIFTFVGMYRTWFAASRFDELSTLFKSSFVGIFVLFFVIFIDDYVHNISSSSRILVFIYWGLFLFFVGAGRLFIRSFQRNLLIKGIGRKSALIVGFNPKGFEVQNQVQEHRALGLDVKGFVSLNGANIGKTNEDIAVLGDLNELPQIIDREGATEVIIALNKEDRDKLVDIISYCEGKNVGLKIAPDLYEILSGQARTTQIYGISLIDIMPQLMPEWEKRLKRLLDIFVSLIILLVTVPISVMVSLLIKIDSKGPVFFRQKRCGMNGEVFTIIKFRSMHTDAEKETGPVWSSKDDPRITRIGRIIRKMRIDEIPQMFNVLKGEMSLVGPRPERPFFVEKLSGEIPFYSRRLKVVRDHLHRAFAHGRGHRLRVGESVRLG